MPVTKRSYGLVVFFVLLASLFIPRIGTAQTYDTVSVFKLPVQLDSYVVKVGFDLDAFIRRVRNDTTFYKAFRHMRLVPYHADNDIRVYDKGDRVVASLKSKTQQVVNKGCRTTKVVEEKTTGDFYKKNGEYRYYTAELFAYLFFAKQPICNENDIVAGALDAKGKGQNAKYAYELKQLLFNPGSKISGVPFMGDRASIFDEDEARKYDFKIAQENHDGVSCYVFRITPKAGFERKTLYRELTTWFRVKDYSILARDYSLSYSTLVYDFDVHMKVSTKQVGKSLVPTRVDYDGNWHILTKKRERVKFTATMTY